MLAKCSTMQLQSLIYSYPYIMAVSGSPWLFPATVYQKVFVMEVGDDQVKQEDWWLATGDGRDRWQA